jgi:ABC-type bacteriocin/lantibiotic exporter with double-glycine peptidase domain
MKTLFEFVRALQAAERRKLAWVMLGIAVSGVMDVAGIASVAPFLTLVANPGAVRDLRGLSLIQEFFGVTHERDLVVVVGLLSLAVIVAANALNAWVTWTQVKLTNMVGFTVSRRLLHAYVRQPQLLLTNRNTAELGRNILSEVDRGISGALLPALTLVSRTTAVLCIGTFLFFVEPTMALTLALIFGGVYGLIYLGVRRLLAAMGKSAVEDNNQRFRIVAEAFGALRELRIYGRLAAFVGRFDMPAFRYAKVTAVSLLIGQMPRYMLEPLAFGSIVFIVIYALWLGNDFASVLPLIGLFAFAGYRLMPAFQSIFFSFSALRFYLPSLRSILDGLASEVMDEPVAVRHESGVPRFANKLEFMNVGFTYPDRSRVLDRVDLIIEANTTVGIIGRTGSGKTTLVSLILGLLAPTSGTIRVDGIALEGGRLAAWQRRIGYVPQDVFLIDDSIAANIALGVAAEEIDRAAVERAARFAGIHDFIASTLPQGYEAHVGERGARLSGGQRQRIGIARALYHDPDVVIFDEATSGLDTETEDTVISAIDNLAMKRTLIIISHRAATLRYADVVHLLENGRIAASGPIDRFAPMFGPSGEPGSHKCTA